MQEMNFFAGHVERAHLTFDDKHPIKKETTLPGQIEFKPIGMGKRAPVLKALPLLRGYHDSITRGDLVLITVIGGKRFYLGPINTFGNPTKSPDHTYVSRQKSIDSQSDREDGYNKEMPSEQVVLPRLTKKRNWTMDFPYEYEKEIVDESSDFGVKTIAESMFSDLMLEGRYGNAIRIGARNFNPQILISNHNQTAEETLGIGSHIAMLSFGTIAENFNIFPEEEYRLSSDGNGNVIANGNNVVNERIPQNRFNYQYGKIKPLEEELSNDFDQILITSDRIIFDGALEDVTISANRNINLGANNNFTLNNKGFSVFQSENIYIGKEAKKREEPMVLGFTLRNLLLELLELISNVNALGMNNAPQELTLGPAAEKLIPGAFNDKIKELITKYKLNQEPTLNINDNDEPRLEPATGLATFLSGKHFIEPNG